MTVQVEAAVAENLPVDALLGTDVPELTKLIRNQATRKPRTDPILPKQEDMW